MKNYTISNLRFLLVTVICFFSGCKNPEQSGNNGQQSNTLVEQKFIPKHGKLYFDYDVIDHYHISIDENAVMILDSSQNRSKKDQLKLDILINKTSKDINDTEFIKSLEKIGFKKSVIKTQNFKKINEIFIEKTVSENIEYACVPIYRDILIFKKQKAIIGIAKICFDCHQKHIVGTNANTEDFGQDDDYPKLLQVINTN
ncbi:hypothetical protein [Chryseobacterium lathyri]|jgi:hypothetical protein|uniref:DUF3365 domain-containing protein n=1 Tax=Chryseobacterium lathyri TaxID=395933 RepID=A0A511YBI3_9FLAO|nr:hypothetical protein [Chryseobacterium lathyri]GEN72524.1 hypothetical protein CLA01_25960 [Chryseobacterium lathyri]